MTIFKSIRDSKPPHRILSMDGGGIYGISTAILLKKLCEKNEDFLTGEDISLFAGTSAGALSCLALAQQDCPRDYVLSGKLEEIFQEEKMYSNSQDPFFSLAQITAWASEADYRQVLDKYYGDTRLGELKHRVLITCFNYGSSDPCTLTKNKSWTTKIFHNFPHNACCKMKVTDIAYGATTPPGFRITRNGLGDGGQFAPDPSGNAIAKIINEESLHNALLQKIADLINNMTLLKMQSIEAIFKKNHKMIKQCCEEDKLKIQEFHDLDKQMQSIEIQPQAMLKSLMTLINHIKKDDKKPIDTFHKVINLISEFNNILKHIVNVADLHHIKDSHREGVNNLEASLNSLRMMAKGGDDNRLNDMLPLTELILVRIKGFIGEIIKEPFQSISDISLLSLGVCNEIPHYWLDDFNLSGPLFYNKLPTNPMANYWSPPGINLPIMAPTADENLEARQILGPQFFRLSPEVIGPPIPPILNSVYLCRFTMWREWIAAQIKQLMTKPIVDTQVAETLQWMKNPDSGWPN